MNVQRMLRSASVLIDNLCYALSTSKPRLILKLIRNHMLVRMGRSLPRSLTVAVEYQCNQACEHCSARFLNDSSKPAMTLDQHRSLADQAARMGFFNIQFTGGEPLLREDLEDIIRLFRPNENFIMISTNGTLLDTRRIRSLKRVGVDALCVSLDSSDPQVHDSFRGVRGAWRKTVDAVKLARRSGLKVALGAIVTHHNIRSPDLKALAVFARSLGCGMLLNWACPVGAWSGNRQARLTEEDAEHLFRFLERHHHARTDFHGNYKHRGCPAVKEMMYITVQGEFLPCAFIPISYGNVTQEPLDVLRNRALEDSMYRKYWSRCLSGSNDTFYHNYLKPTFSRRSPLHFKQLPHAAALCV